MPKTVEPMTILCAICVENGYHNPKILADGRWSAVMPLLFTAAIITMEPDIEKASLWYEDRWCYHSLPDAVKALSVWNGEGEPDGWHRHPQTGRRRTNGDPLAEYIHH